MSRHGAQALRFPPGAFRRREQDNKSDLQRRCMIWASRILVALVMRGILWGGPTSISDCDIDGTACVHRIIIDPVHSLIRVHMPAAVH